MNRIIAFIALLASTIGAYAANPAFTAFIGTNQVSISSNVTTGKIIIGPAVPISTTASNAATALNLWTNEVSDPNVTYLLDAGASRVLLGTFGIERTNVQLMVNAEARGDVSADKIYQRRGVFGIIGGEFDSVNPVAVGVGGFADYGSPTNVGLFGFATAQEDGAKGIGVLGSGIADGAAGTRWAVGGYFEIAPNNFTTMPNVDTNAAIILDAGVKGDPILIGRTNNGAMVVRLNSDGSQTNASTVSATGGFASYSTIATNAVGGTGYTNNQAINQVVYANGTAVAVTIKNRAGTTIVPATTFTGTMTIMLQPGWAFTAASGLTGTATPF